MATKIPKGFKGKINIGNFRDADGHPATIDKILGITVADPSLSEVLTEGADTFVAPRLDVDPVGDNQQVLIEVDVREGPDVFTRTFLAFFDVPAGEAALADVTIGEVVPR